MPTITVDSHRIAQRLRCPNGHASVAPTNEHWWCRQCAAHWDDVEMDDSVRGCYYA